MMMRVTMPHSSRRYACTINRAARFLFGCIGCNPVQFHWHASVHFAELHGHDNSSMIVVVYASGEVPMIADRIKYKDLKTRHGH
jgi:hypothetical protein